MSIAVNVNNKYIVGSLNINLNDFKSMSEEVLTEKFNVHITTLYNKGELNNYKEALRTSKNDLNVKRNAYNAMITGKSVKKEYWNDVLEPYFKKIGFKYETEEKYETISTRNSETKELELKQVLMIRVTNNISSVNKDLTKNIKATLNLIISAFNLESDLETSFKNLLTSLETEKAEDIKEGHIIKTNSDLYKEANNYVSEIVKNEILTNNSYLLKVQSSIDFINWKLRLIRLYENDLKKAESDLKLDEMNVKIEKRLKTDKTFSNLRDIVKKNWG